MLLARLRIGLSVPALRSRMWDDLGGRRPVRFPTAKGASALHTTASIDCLMQVAWAAGSHGMHQRPLGPRRAGTCPCWSQL